MDEKMKKLEQIASQQEVAQVEALSQENKLKFFELSGDNLEALKVKGMKIAATIALLIAFVIAGQQDANAQTNRKKAIKFKTEQAISQTEIPPTPKVKPPKKLKTEEGDGTPDDINFDDDDWGEDEVDFTEENAETEKMLADAKARLQKACEDENLAKEELLVELRKFVAAGGNPATEFDWYEKIAKKYNITSDDLVD